VTLGGQSQEVPAFALFFIAMPVLFCVLFIALLALAFLMTEYVLTNKRLNFRTGVFFSVSGELRLEDVEAVFLITPFLGRLLGYGTVVVTGRGGTPFPLRFMPRPDVFHTRLREALEAARTGRNLRPPSPAALSPTPRPATPSRSDPEHPGQREATVPLEKAWEELNKPLPTLRRMIRGTCLRGSLACSIRTD